MIGRGALPEHGFSRRAGAYAVVRESGRVLLVRTNGGRLYLPGGRLHAGETPEQALRREVAEECGFHCTVGVRIGERLQPVYDGRWLILAHYFEADLTRPAGPAEHDLVWLLEADAAASVHREGDAWAIARAVGAAPKVKSALFAEA